MTSKSWFYIDDYAIFPHREVLVKHVPGIGGHRHYHHKTGNPPTGQCFNKHLPEGRGGDPARAHRATLRYVRLPAFRRALFATSQVLLQCGGLGQNCRKRQKSMKCRCRRKEPAGSTATRRIHQQHGSAHLSKGRTW